MIAVIPWDRLRPDSTILLRWLSVHKPRADPDDFVCGFSLHVANNSQLSFTSVFTCKSHLRP